MNIMNILHFLYLFAYVFAYDSFTGQHFTNISQSSYCVGPTIDWTCNTCNNNVVLDYIVENKGSRAIMGYDKLTKTLFVAFRGSSNIQNWINNLQVSKISPYENESIHVEKGFYTSYIDIKSQIFSNLHQLAKKYDSNQMSVTGHSLGAAQATLFSYDLLTNSTYDLLNLYTFGSPRVGNKYFSYDFTDKFLSTRITHYHDIVPHVPEEFLGYLHIGNEVWYNRPNSEYIICNDEYEEDNTCSNSCSPTHCTSIDDHLHYVNISMGNDYC